MKKSIAAFLSLAAMIACQKTENPGLQDYSTVKIAPVITKVTDVNFEEGDMIGLTIMRGDAAYAENEPLTFSDGVFSGNLLWYAEAAETSDITAYYPYSADGMPATFSVAADQTGSGYQASDLIAGTKPDVTPSATAVTVNFRHLLTKILLNITNDSGSEITAVKLSGSKLTADVNLDALTVSVSDAAEAEDITAQAVSAGRQYRAIVIPQTVAFRLSVTTADGKTLGQDLASTELKSGGQYTMTARITQEGLKVTVAGEIGNWTDEGEIGPDVPSEEVTFEEFDGYFIYDGERYNTVTLANGSVWMAEPMRYIPEGYTPSSDPTADSHIWYPYMLENDGEATSINASRAVALTDEESIKEKGYLYDWAIALGTDEITPENAVTFEGAQGICPPGWHIPTRADFFNLCGLSNAAQGETGNQINEEALFYDSTYGGGKWTSYDEAGWNYVLTGTRMKSSYTGTAKYQLTQLYSGNTSLEDMYGQSGLTYIMSSTFYKSGTSNLQFFAQMTTFSKTYPEGRINVSFAHYESGVQLRCVKDAE